MWKCPKCGRSFSREGQGHYCGRIVTVDQYIQEQAEDTKPYLIEIRQILREAIPEAQEKISWSIPIYIKGRHHEENNHQRNKAVKKAHHGTQFPADLTSCFRLRAELSE